MKYLSITSIFFLLAMFLSGCNQDESPTSSLVDSSNESLTGSLSKNNVVHHISVGGADICVDFGLKPGCDGNFSLVAIEKADGSVSGQWQDSFGHGNGSVHITVDCLFVDGNQAWVGGVVNAGPFAGVRVMTRVVDNGTSAKDPADQISFTTGSDVSCITAPDLPLIDLTHGQVKVR